MQVNFDGSDLKRTLFKVCQVLGGSISVGAPGTIKGKNLDCDPQVSLVVVAADTDTAATHHLGRIPVGYWIIGSSAKGVVYDGTGGVAAFTATTVTLRSSVTGTYRVLVF